MFNRLKYKKTVYKLLNETDRFLPRTRRAKYYPLYAICDKNAIGYNKKCQFKAKRFQFKIKKPSQFTLKNVKIIRFRSFFRENVSILCYSDE